MTLWNRVRTGWGIAIGMAVGLGGFSGAHAAPVPARLVELLGSEAGAAILYESPAGRELAKRLLGRRLGIGNAESRIADLRALRSRLERPDAERLHSELLSRLERAEAELGPRAARGALAPARRKALIQEVSARYFGLEPTGAHRIEFVALGDSGASAAYQSSRLRLVQGASKAGATSFEALLPVERGSMTDRLGQKIYDELIEIETYFMIERGLGDADAIASIIQAERGARQGVRLVDIADHVFAEREALAQRLEALGKRYHGQDPLLSDTLRQAAGKIHLSRRSVRKFDQKASDFADEAYQGRQSADAIMDYVAAIPGELGELKVALRVGGLSARGLKVGELAELLASGRNAQLIRSRLNALRDKFPQYLDKELDLIFAAERDVMRWGEVKNYHGGLSPEHPFYEKVMVQAEKTVKIRSLLTEDPVIGPILKAMGKRIELRIYFIHGIRADSARVLEEMGFEVIGPRLPINGGLAPAPLPAAA